MNITRALIFLLFSILALPLQAAVFTVDYSDGPNFGFNDNTPVDPVPGNPATTLGEQRRAVFDAAIDIWASRLDSNAAIRVETLFEDLGCGESTTLGFGGSVGLSRNFFNAPLEDTNYPLSLAAALRGQIYSTFESEIRVRFNFRIDSEECSENVEGYWYGLDPLTPPALSTASFLELVLHELGHGLGFQSLTDRDDRTFFGDPPAPDVMSSFIFGIAQDQSWTEMTASQRVQTATSGANLVWTGSEANLRAAERLLPPGQIVSRPGQPGSQTFEAFIQGFAPFLPLEGLAEELALAQGPGVGPGPSDPWHRSLACEPLDNLTEVAGKLVLVRRGECFFAVKWQNVFDAGGAGIIIVDNQPAGSDNAIARDFGIAVDRNLPIPIWMVSDTTGTSLRNGLPNLPIHLGYDLDSPPRGTNQGFINLQASTENTDSNVSHFSNTLAPLSLMNPNLSNSSFGGDLDQVPELLRDIGWPGNEAKRGQYSGNWFNPQRDGEGCQLTLEDDQDIPVMTCYMYRDGEQFWLIGNGVDLGDRWEFNEMTITRGTGYGDDFNPDDVIREFWGNLIMRPVDCNQARFDFQPVDPELPTFTSQMVKIVGGSCNLRASEQPIRFRNGTYFDPSRDGEGVQLAVQADGLSWVMTFYTYLDGEQAWMIGSGSRLGNKISFGDMAVTRGGDYGPNFDPDDIELINVGTIELEFINCNDISLDIQSVLPEFPSDQREMTRIIGREC